MKILISGSTGLVGGALSEWLKNRDHQIVRLVRHSTLARAAEILWNPGSGVLDATVLEEFDAVVHLAGHNIAARRWTKAQKSLIRDSRVNSTRLLCETLAQLKRPPKVLVSASAIGIYGHRGAECLTEESPPGTGFLAEVGRQWEAATQPAIGKGTRVVCLRLGIVLSPRGGALAKMLLPFKLGLGGVVGSGGQYWSWTAIDDVVEAIGHILANDSLCGPLNMVSPAAVTNREFTKALGMALSRPTLIPMPAFAARLALGEMAEETLLASTRVYPAKLLASGYRFLYPELAGALRHLLTD